MGGDAASRTSRALDAAEGQNEGWLERVDTAGKEGRYVCGASTPCWGTFDCPLSRTATQSWPNTLSEHFRCVEFRLMDSQCSMVDSLWPTWSPCRSTTGRMGKSVLVHWNRHCCFCCPIPRHSLFFSPSTENDDQRMAGSHQRISQGTDPALLVE